MNSLFSLHGKVAVVTGAAGLLGKEHCRALHGAGASVIACDKSREVLSGLEREIRVPIIPMEADITDKGQVEEALKQIVARFSRVDILINNAAINDKVEEPSLALENSRLENYPTEQWEKMWDVNVTGMFYCSQVFGTHMAKMKKGSIVNIASTYGMVAPDQSLYQDENGTQLFFKSCAYSTTKGAVISMTRFLAGYWGKVGVRVNSLSPGGVENSQAEYFVKNYSKKVPLGRMAEKSDFHGALVFLSSDASSYMTGANLVVDGGWTTW